MKRLDCLKLLASWMNKNMLTATSLSANYREWASAWKEGANFYALNLGMCVPFALGLSLAFPRRKVIALDSDGSLLLDTSSLVTVAQVNPANLITLVFDNSVYGRMGATATARTADLEKIAQGAGIKNTATIRSLDEFERVVKAAMDGSELAFFVVKVERGREPIEYDHRRTHGRAMKEAFVEALRHHPDYQGKDRKSSE